jgi:hypothetical protein
LWFSAPEGRPLLAQGEVKPKASETLGTQRKRDETPEGRQNRIEALSPLRGLWLLGSRTQGLLAKPRRTLG